MFGNSKINFNDTIYAPASSPQKSGVIIIRVSGTKVPEVISKLSCSITTPRYATLTNIYHPVTQQLIDQPIAIYYKSPHSFTGEDVLELNLHGSRAIVKLTMNALASIDDLRIAEPGEFSMRSFMNGKMDLTQVEGLADLIDAETEAQHRQAFKQMSGSLKEVYYGWRQRLLKIISLLEANIDFPDEDIPLETIDETKQKIKTLSQNIDEHLKDKEKGQKLRDGLYVAILGPTNVGKSSIINRIAKKDVAIVSQIEGTTRDVIEINLDIRGYPVAIADTAGLRESKDTLENEGIKRSLERAKDADLKIIVVDATQNHKKQQHALDLIDEKTIIVINKADLVSKVIKDKIKDKQALVISAKENKGIDNLIKTIAEYTEKFFENLNAYPLITRQRYRENLLECSKILHHLNLDGDIVLAAEDMRVAANHIGSITGEIDVESILGEIFSNFCIGK
jgi:tRNA modification GTPase